MKKLIIPIILAILLLGLAGCRSADEAAQVPVVYRFYDGVYVRDFHLPLSGGGRTLFGSTNRRDGAVAQALTGGAVADAAPPPPASEPMPAAESPDIGQVEWDDIAGQGERHIIQTASVELETEYFNEVVDQLRRIAPDVNGYISSEMLAATARPAPRFTIVLRVPAATFDMVLSQVEALAYVRVRNQWAQDVTDQFYDMIGSLEIRQVEEERILALIDEAETVQELLALEQRLGNTRLVIERYLSQLNEMAGQIAYSTITVTLIDVSEVEDTALAPTMGERIGGAFGASIGGTVRAVQGVIVFMAGAIIPMTILGLAAFGAYKIARKIFAKRLNA